MLPKKYIKDIQVNHSIIRAFTFLFSLGISVSAIGQNALQSGGSYISKKAKTIYVFDQQSWISFDSNFDDLEMEWAGVSDDSTEFSLCLAFHENGKLIVNGETYEEGAYVVKNDTIFFTDDYTGYPKLNYAVFKENGLELTFKEFRESEEWELFEIDFRSLMTFNKEEICAPPPHYQINELQEVASAEVSTQHEVQAIEVTKLPLKTGGSYIGNELITNKRITFSNLTYENTVVDIEGESRDFYLYLELQEDGQLALNGKPVNNVKMRNDSFLFKDISMGPFEFRYAKLMGEQLEVTLTESYELYREDNETGDIFVDEVETLYIVPLTYKKKKYYKQSKKTVDSMYVEEILALPEGSYFSKFERDEDSFVMDSLNADIILWGYMGGDGMRMIRNKETKKWGVYQVSGYKSIHEFIPMAYDSLRSFEQNEWFTAVYNNGKVGFYLAAWSFGVDAKQTVPCEYDAYQIYQTTDYPPVPYLAVKKDGKWAWVDWLNGELKSEFVDELKSIPFEQRLSFED